MTFVGSHSLEAARAAALASHSAAGLASSAGLRTAARLLRSSEALARAAVAAIQDAGSRRDSASPASQGASPSGGGPGPAGNGAPRAPGALPARPPRRRRKKKVAEKDENMGVDIEGASARLEPLVGALSADAAVFVPAALSPRVLCPAPRASLAHSSSAACSSTASIADLLDFAVGSAVVFTGLVSRPDLVDKGGTVISFDMGASRYAVRVLDTGESVKVLAKNLKMSS